MAAAETPPDKKAKPSARRRWKRFRRRARAFAELAIKTLIVVALFVVVLFWDRIVHSVYPGQMGVHWSRLMGGTVLDKTYTEGMRVIWPWDEFYIYDMREQELHQETLIYARDGLEIRVSTSVRFRPTPAYLPRLHQDIGPKYVEKVVAPEVISSLRKVIGNYTPEDIYSKDEQGLLADLGRTLRADLNSSYFEVTEFLVLELRLPPTIEQAIKDKLTEEQKMLAYRFRLRREEDEKLRRIIEAEGLRAFETISRVPILKWRGLEATEKLATSANAKVVLMGTGEGQLPIILNADVPSTASAAPAVPPPAQPDGSPAQPDGSPAQPDGSPQLDGNPAQPPAGGAANPPASEGKP